MPRRVSFSILKQKLWREIAKLFGPFLKWTIQMRQIVSQITSTVQCSLLKALKVSGDAGSRLEESDGPLRLPGPAYSEIFFDVGASAPQSAVQTGFRCKDNQLSEVAAVFTSL